MRFGLFGIMLCGCLMLTACSLISSSPMNWSKNIAIDASGSDTKFNDDNIYTEGETGPITDGGRDMAAQREADNYTEAVLTWKRPQTIQQVIVKAKVGELEFFEIQYYLDESEEWITVKSVRDNVRPAYKFTMREPIITTKFRLKVPRRWDSRRVTGQKRSQRSETGAPTTAEHRKIQEIEIYYALPTPTADTAPTQ